MIRRRAALMAVAAAARVVALVPARRALFAAKQRRAPVPIHATATMDLKSTIGSIFVPNPPPPPATVVEGAENFRMLGIPPDAEYDEVQAAVTNLKEKYAGDTKKLLKIDVAKDKIAELRLRQRVSGTFGVTAEVAARDRTIQTFENQALNRAVAKATPSFVRKVPKMWKPFWKIDELYANRKDRELQRAHVKMAATYGAGFCALAVFFPGGINYIKFGAPLVLVSHMAQRGQPPVPKDGRGMSGAVRDPIYSDYLWGGFFLLVHSIAGNFVATQLAPYMPLLRPRQLRFIVGTACMALADTVWQPHQGNN